MAELENAKAFHKRDALLHIESEMQKIWESEHRFETDAPSLEDQQQSELDGMKTERYTCNFPYPYMNGRLHLGHAFSLSKCEFAAGFEMLKGKKVLWPFGFHCTGMPIKACADKLAREIQEYGNPPNMKLVETAAKSAEESTAAAQKSKIAAKTGGIKLQYQIMQSLGIPDSEIPQFRDPQHWLKYFPPQTIADLKTMGCKIDWRRAFITTDANPFYDSFIQWQFNKLKALNKVKFGKRHTIFSPLDKQPCMDHDRSSGEGVGPQEYTGLKMKMLPPFNKGLEKLDGRDVFLVAATLRPETMYGQTNCFVGTDLDYIAFEARDGSIYVSTHRAALNMAYQGLTKIDNELDIVMTLQGNILIGASVRSPLSVYPKIFVLPMEQILASKGTGIVTSCPSDSADDFVMLTTLQRKAEYYKIKDEWVQGFYPVPLINTPTFGSLSAPAYCKENKITSPKDKAQLDLAKEALYKEGFYKGVMLIGDCKDMLVCDAKPIIRKQLVDAGDAIPYYEPEKEVMSRSGDSCVVSLVDQWYLDYGEPSWREQAQKCVDSLRSFHAETKNAFDAVLGWLNQWACSRSFGLGTKIPWDPSYLIESLSDSTIYMSYYTVAHILHENNLNGALPTKNGIKPEDMTAEVWDHVLSDGAAPKNCKIPASLVQRMKAEFNYWYPWDVRCSGKDLVPNHLTFSIYNHVALFPESQWPRGVRVNGHLLVDNEKMAKSKGNFITLADGIKQFSADAMRLTLAGAGDMVDDANFAKDVVNQSILRLFALKEWCEEFVNKAGELRTGVAAEYTFDDKYFLAQMRLRALSTEQEYVKTFYREVLTHGFYELLNTRDRYLLACELTGLKPHCDLIFEYMRTQLVLIAPITPHICDYIWRNVLKEKSSVLTASFPSFDESQLDREVLAAGDFLDGFVRSLRLARISLVQSGNKKKKAGAAAFDEESFSSLTIFVAKSFPAWQNEVVLELKDLYDPVIKTFPLMAESGNTKALTAHFSAKRNFQALMKGKSTAKKFMPFLVTFANNVVNLGPSVFDRQLGFDESSTLRHSITYLKSSLNLKHVDVQDAPEDENADGGRAEPGVPAFVFRTE